MQTGVLDIVGWPRVAMSPTACAQEVARFMPLGLVGHPATEHEHGHGQVVWGIVRDGTRMAIAWDWTEAAPGIVVLADPMVVLTNLQLVDNEGFPLSYEDRILALSAAINGWDWQSAVVAAGASRRT